MRNLIILLGLVILVSACKNPSFKDIDFNNGDYKLYFIDMSYLGGYIDTNIQCDFQEKYRIFKIQNPKILTDFQNDYLKEYNQSITEDENRCLYVLELINGEKLEWGAFIDWNNKLLENSSEQFFFNTERFKNDSLNFISTPSYKIRINELHVARKLYDILVENGAYMHGIQFLKENPLFTFNGQIELKTDTSKLNMNRKHEEIEAEIYHDFKELGKIRIRSFYFNIDSPSIKLTIQSEKDISNSVPKKYEVTKKFNPIENIEFYAIDINEQKLVQLIDMHELNGITYEKL